MHLKSSEKYALGLELLLTDFESARCWVLGDRETENQGRCCESNNGKDHANSGSCAAGSLELVPPVL